MGWFTSVKSFFTKTPGKTVDDIFDKDNGLLAQAGGFIGNLSLTDEEVMERNGKTVDSVQKFVVDTLSESTERSKSRRDIASMWIKTQLAILLMACIAGPFDLALAKFYFAIGTSALMIAGTSAIIVFHFGSYGLVRKNESEKE
jgi:hypothetical protein